MGIKDAPLAVFVRRSASPPYKERMRRQRLDSRLLREIYERTGGALAPGVEIKAFQGGLGCSDSDFSTAVDRLAMAGFIESLGHGTFRITAKGHEAVERTHERRRP